MCVLDVGQDAVVEHGWCVESWAVVMLQTQAEELAVGVYARGGGGGGGGGGRAGGGGGGFPGACCGFERC
jgi:hypothetical protein